MRHGHHVFRSRQPETGRGRSQLVPWLELATAQVVIVIQYAGQTVTGTLHHLVQGNTHLFLALRWSVLGHMEHPERDIPELTCRVGASHAVVGSLGRDRRVRDVHSGSVVYLLHNSCGSPVNCQSSSTASRRGRGYYRPCLDSERTPAPSRAPSPLGVTASSRASLYRSSGSPLPVMSQPSLSIEPSTWEGVVGLCFLGEP